MISHSAPFRSFRCLSVAEQVAEYLREPLREGRWPVNGEQLPPVRQLAEQLGVSLSSAQEALRLLSESGVPTSVMAAPMVPAINDSELERILDAGAAQGATGAGMILLRLPGEVRDDAHVLADDVEP